MENQG